MDSYLNTAEQVLFMVRRPLRPKEILEEAFLARLVPWHLRGPRQDKTLHARLSEDIARNRENSRFFRTAAGVFFLRRFIADGTIPERDRTEYYAPPRRKELGRSAILYIELPPGSYGQPDRGLPASTIVRTLRSGRYGYRSYTEIAANPALAAVHSFVVVYRDDKVLSFRSGKFFPTTDPQKMTAQQAADREVLSAVMKFVETAALDGAQRNAISGAVAAAAENPDSENKGRLLSVLKGLVSGAATIATIGGGYAAVIDLVSKWIG